MLMRYPNHSKRNRKRSAPDPQPVQEKEHNCRRRPQPSPYNKGFLLPGTPGLTLAVPPVPAPFRHLCLMDVRQHPSSRFPPSPLFPLTYSRAFLLPYPRSCLAGSATRSGIGLPPSLIPSRGWKHSNFFPETSL